LKKTNQDNDVLALLSVKVTKFVRRGHRFMENSKKKKNKRGCGCCRL
jgi:hypothetical protein